MGVTCRGPELEWRSWWRPTETSNNISKKKIDFTSPASEWAYFDSFWGEARGWRVYSCVTDNGAAARGRSVFLETTKKKRRDETEVNSLHLLPVIWSILFSVMIHFLFYFSSLISLSFFAFRCALDAKKKKEWMQALPFLLCVDLPDVVRIERRGSFFVSPLEWKGTARESPWTSEPR